MRLTFTIPGPPQPKERARRGRGNRWYTPERTRRYESAVGETAQVAVFGQHGFNWRTDVSYHVELSLYFPDARAKDIDNVAKACLDGCNKILWADDRQVARVTVSRDIDRANPRTEIVVVAHEAEVVPPKPRRRKVA